MAEWWNGGTAETTSLGCQQVCTTVHEKRVSSRVPSEGSMEHFPNRFSMRQIAFPRRGNCGRYAREKLQRQKPKQQLPVRTTATLRTPTLIRLKNGFVFN